MIGGNIMLIDRLYNEVEKSGNVCVGLDSLLEYIPNQLKEKYQDIEEIIFQFNRRIIDKTMDIVPVYKLQIAAYESYGLKGLMAYKKTLEYLRHNDIITIGDIKRGDIDSTARMYGKAHFEGDFEVDFITLNPYMGFDSITPYLDYVENSDKGILVLIRTSNPGAKDLQFLNVDSNNTRLYYYVGDKLGEISQDYRGSCGYSQVGMVVGCTHKEEVIEIRKRYKDQFFLIPGYGHQGGKGDDAVLYLNDGNGGVVNSSRGIITAYKAYQDGEENFDNYARQAVLDMKHDIERYM